MRHEHFFPFTRLLYYSNEKKKEKLHKYTTRWLSSAVCFALITNNQWRAALKITRIIIIIMVKDVFDDKSWVLNQATHLITESVKRSKKKTPKTSAIGKMSDRITLASKSFQWDETTKKWEKKRETIYGFSSRSSASPFCSHLAIHPALRACVYFLFFFIVSSLSVRFFSPGRNLKRKTAKTNQSNFRTSAARRERFQFFIGRLLKVKENEKEKNFEILSNLRRAAY